MQVGISILIGGYAIGWLSDKIGRRKALILSSVLAGVFIWPFGYVTNYSALFVLSIADTLGFAGYLAINVVYMSEIMGPTWRRKVMLPCQAVCIFLLFVVVGGILPHYWFPVHYRWFLWLLAGLNIVVAISLFFRMPESPRWLEAKERRAQARKVMERMEARVMKRPPRAARARPVAVRGGSRRRRPPWWAPFGKNYVVVTVFLLVVMMLGYAGIVYGGASQILLYLDPQGRLQRRVHLRHDGLGRRGRHRHLPAQRILRRPAGAQMDAAHRRRLLCRRLLGACTSRCTAAWPCTSSTALSYIGLTLWLWSMYVYIPQNYPTRMRSLGTGWTDGVGHLGAWGGVLIAGALFTVTAPRPFFLFVTIPCALLPGILIAIFGKNQRSRALEELSQKIVIAPAAPLPGMRMAVRMWPADVGSAWLCETVQKIDAGALTFGCPPVAPRTRVSVSQLTSGAPRAACVPFYCSRKPGGWQACRSCMSGARRLMSART